MTLLSTVVFVVFIVGSLFVSNTTPLQFVVSTYGELQWALQSVKAGDEILLGHAEIQWQNGPFRSYAHGTPDYPITVRGLGSDSVLTRGPNPKTAFAPPDPEQCFELEHSYWRFENLRFTGYYDSAIYIHPPVDGVEIRNVAFEHMPGVNEGTGYGAGVVNFGHSILIDNCSFLVTEVGVSVSSSDMAKIEITNNHFEPFNDAPEPDRAKAVNLSGGNIVVANNTFSSEKGVFWLYFVGVRYGRGVIKDNVGHLALSDGFEVNGRRELEQEYIFDGNHCDIQSNTWCINVINNFSYNTTTIYDNNTFENARGLTNKPQN